VAWGESLISTSNNSITAHINHRILLGTRCYYGLRNLITINIIKERCKIYNTLIRATVLYETESWTHTKADEEKLRIFEREILRKIYGPTCESDV
jgi:hypothetical protein